MNKPVILIVDDESINIEIIANYLQDDYALKIATNGKDALELLAKTEVDLILLDIFMPIMDGYETCRLIKENPQTNRIPIIFITTQSDEMSIEKAYEAGGTDYVTKPFKPKELLARIHKELKLFSLINELESKVTFQVDEIKKQEKMVLHQSNLAQMGEMLNMIAHQWRQPLNAVSASSINLAFQNELGTLTPAAVTKATEFIQDQAQKMSHIIDDFMELNKSESNSRFFIYEAISKVAQIVSAQFASRNIFLEIDVNENIKIFHNFKALEHVLLNLLNNAKDAFEEKKEITNKIIKIYAKQENNAVILVVEDSAGGIPEHIIDKVFLPYFTTKEQGKGTGIGLYMTKQMIENIEGSKIEVSNSDIGAKFIITIPHSINEAQ